MDIDALLLEKRPNLALSSRTAYKSTLSALYKKLYNGEFNVSKFNTDFKRVLDYLEDVPYNKRKSILAPLFIITGNPAYQEQMNKDIAEFNKNKIKMNKSETESENWLTQDEIRDAFLKHEAEAHCIMKKTDLSMPDLQIIQNYIILCLTSGIYIPPRRSLDFTVMKWKGGATADSNYYDSKKKQFIFNVYKTAKTAGQFVEKVPVGLSRILTKWLKINPTDYMLFDRNKNPLSAVKMTQRMNKIFGKKASVNIMRHSYLTEKYKDAPTTEEMQETADQMGHTVATALEYRRK